MGVISNVINTLSCGLSGLLGQGNEGCTFDFENMSGGKLVLFKNNFIVPALQDFNRAYIRSQQLLGNVVVLGGIYDVEWTTGENTKTAANGSGLNSVSRAAIYGIKVMFKKGLYNQRQLSSISIDDFWGVALMDGEDNILGVYTDDGFKGFSTSMFHKMPITFKNGTNIQMTGLEIEFSRSVEFNDRISFINAEDVDFEEIDDVNNVNVSVPVAPLNGDTVFDLRAVLAKDGSFHAGLTTANLLVKNSAGATIAATVGVGDDVAKTYPITLPAVATGEVYNVSYYSSVDNSIVVTLGTIPNDKLYKSNTVTFTVV